MTDLRTAAQQALEALEMLAQPTKTNSETPRYKAHKAAITALRAALAQQTQTPCDIAEDGVCEVIDCCGKPPQRAQEEQPIRAHWMALPEAPKGGGNLPPPLQAEPVQEPVAWMTHTNDLLPLFHKNRKAALNWQTQPTPLYTAPPRREWQSLSEEEIDRWTPEIHPVIRFIEGVLKERNA